MKIATALSPATYGSAGTFNVWDQAGNKELVPLPETVNTLDQKPDFILWRRGNFSRTYVLGGHTDNLVFTEQMWLLRMGINAPSGPIVTSAPVENQVGIAASGAAGLTGSCSVALRFLDSLHSRRSPLGAASPAVVLAGQGMTFTNLPTAPVPNDPCVDSIEVWVSVDGGLFRHWATRDIGATTFTVNETATGEAYTSELAQLPKLGFGCMANDRGFYAGDPRHPERVYISELGQPEEYGGLYIPTRNGEPVIGLKNVGGSTIYVQCPNSSYYINGFGPSDFVMRVLKPTIGGYGQDSIAELDEIVVFPTQRGWFRFDGTSMVPIGVGDWDETWRGIVGDAFQRPLYEAGFSATDLVSGVIKFFTTASPAYQIGSRNPSIYGMPMSLNYSWVFAIDGLVPTIPGDGRANLSFDGIPDVTVTAAAMLFDPGASSGMFYSAHSAGSDSGVIVLENQPGKIDRGLTDEGVPLTFIFHTPHHIAGPVADAGDAFQFTDFWAIYQCEYLASVLGVFAGNEFGWQYTPVGGTVGQSAPEQFSVAAGYSEAPAVPTAYVARDRVKRQSLARSTGSSISIRLTVVQEIDDPVPNGEWDPPSSNNTPAPQRALVAFTGWGYVAKDGEDRRTFGLYTSD